MKIAIYDTLHHETVSALLDILSPGNELHVFTSGDFFNMLSKAHPAVHWHYGDEEKWFSLPLLLRKKNKKHDFDLIILNTVHKHHLLYALAVKGRARLIVTIHETSALQPSEKGMRGAIRSAGQQVLNRMASAFFVLSSQVRDHIVTGQLTSKPVIVVPGGLLKGSVSPSLDGDFFVTIPGTIDRSRRNYNELLALLPMLNTTNRKIAIVLLGAAAGAPEIKKMIADAGVLNPAIDLHIFDTDFISQEQYDHWLSRSHFIYLPLQVQKKEATEQYGLTKISGGFFDAVRFAKPMLLPADIPVANEFNEQTFCYASVAELAGYINRAASEPDYLLELHRLSSGNASAFTAENIRQQVMPSIESLFTRPPA